MGADALVLGWKTGRESSVPLRSREERSASSSCVSPRAIPSAESEGVAGGEPVPTGPASGRRQGGRALEDDERPAVARARMDSAERPDPRRRFPPTVPTRGVATIASRGAIAQLGERLDRTQEVGGSSPPSSILESPPLRGFSCDGGVLRNARTGYRPRTSISASSTARSSCASSRPADRPSLCGSTTVVCSTSTRVSSPPSVIVGRKLAARALVEVGDTSRVLRPRSSSACTTTAYRDPRCSCPRARRGGGSRKISPRTTSVRRPRSQLCELFADDPHLLAIALVRGERAHLIPDG